MKLTTAEIREYREQQLKAQNYICPLCGTTIRKEEATLDHDHQTGHVRMVLHRSCNQVEGRILSWIKRSRSRQPKEFLRRLNAYWERDWEDNPLHPKHKTKEQIEIQKLKTKLKTLKAPAAIERHKQLIQELEDGRALPSSNRNAKAQNKSPRKRPPAAKKGRKKFR